MQTVSFQLYSARNFQPFAEVFRILADAGYRQVEGYSALYASLDDAAIQQVKADLDTNGLTCRPPISASTCWRPSRTA